MEKKPNIIYFLSDQHNFAYSGFMGDEYAVTPNMDKLAREGVTFDNCYCNSPLCVPSRMSMLSGLNPSRTKILNNMQMYPTDHVTMAHSITNAGYETVLCGRMHFSGYDQWHGFEKRLVGDVTTSFPGIDNELKMYGYLRGTTYQGRVGVEKVGKGCSTVLKYDELVTETACRFLDDRTDERPLFMIVGSYGPHSPYVAYEKWYNYYYENLPDPRNIEKEYKVSQHPAQQKWIELRDVANIPVETLKKVRAAYYAMITITDENLGQVMKACERNLDMENTVIVYTSDHGDSCGEHGMFWKTNFYDGASKVPAVMSWKNHFKEGARIQNLTSLVDLAPTFIELTGAHELPVMDGQSLVKTLTTGEEPDDKDVISLLGDIKGDNPSAMIRRGNYKLLMHYGYDTQLFDMVADPHENNDIAKDPKYAEVVAELSEELSKWWNAEQANEDLKQAKAHYAILKDWINNVGWKPIFEFDAKDEYNYVLSDEE